MGDPFKGGEQRPRKGRVCHDVREGERVVFDFDCVVILDWGSVLKIDSLV